MNRSNHQHIDQVMRTTLQFTGAGKTFMLSAMPIWAQSVALRSSLAMQKLAQRSSPEPAKAAFTSAEAQSTRSSSS